MKHFERAAGVNYRYLIKDGIHWRLYRYYPRNNEFERGLKYRLVERWYCEDWGEYRETERGKCSSIKEAEIYINNL